MNLIFDLDSTLIDSSRGILNGIKMAFEQCGITPRESLTNKLIGPPLDKLLPVLSGTDDPAVLSPLAIAFQEMYDNEAY